MSKQVDERVVSMQFDNKNFEKNVSTTMSTLDKLKQKLRFEGAATGLENVNSAVKKVDMSGLSSGVETVRAKFSALEVVGVTALANITNSAVNAGKRMVSALTIDPIKTGFQEYETQMGSVQTILANTKSKGSTLDDVNEALSILNKYADQTIYNFTEMTKNIGTFTAAGVGLQTSVDSIKGIANLAAVSGSTSQQASNAMYQLSQALAAGKVSLMDWNSVVNAGMGGELFQNALIRTSELLKTGAKDAIEKYGSFRESLTKGEWLTTEVLTETLKQLSGAYTEADLIAKGFTKEQAKDITTLADDAVAAATKVKTFTQLWDVMKEAAQSGWATTWQLIVGDFEEAKALLSPLAEFFTNVIGKMSDARNKLLEGALGKRFGDLAKSISGVTKPVKDAATAVKDFGDITNKVILGNFGNGQARIDALTKAGYNYYNVQNKVNEALGNGFRYTQEQIDAQDKLLGTQKEVVKSDTERLDKLVKLSEAELKSLGYKPDQIKALKDIKNEADRLGMPIEEFIKNIDNLSGRFLLIESFKNIAKGLGAALTSVKNAWQKVLPPKSMEEKQQGLYNIIAVFHKFSRSVKEISDKASEEGSTVDKLRRTFEGLFTIVKMVSTVVGGPAKVALKVLMQLLAAFDLDILSVTATIGDAIVTFDKWISSTFNFTEAFDKIASGVKGTVTAIREWIDSLKDSKNLPKDIADGIMHGLGVVWSGITGFISELGISISNGLSGAPGDMISGFAIGIRNGMRVAGQVMVELGSQILSKFREVLGIHSPSKETESDGNNFILGFIGGIRNFASKAWDCIKDFASKCIEIVGSIDWGAIFTGAISIASLLLVKKISGALETLAAPFEGIGDVLSGVGKILTSTAKVVKKFSKVLGALAFKTRMDGIKTLAISIAILVGAVIALTFFKPEDLWNSVKVIAALAGVLVALAWITEKLSKASVSIDKNGVNVSSIGKSLIGIAASLLLVAMAVKVIGSLSPEQIERGFDGMWKAITGLVAIIAAYGLLVRGDSAKNIDKAGATILKIGVAMLLLTFVAKIIGGMSWETMGKAAIGIAFLEIVISDLIKATRSGYRIDSVGGTILKIGVAMLLLTFVAKIIGGMEWETMGKAAVGIAFLEIIIIGLIAATRLAGDKEIAKIGSTMTGIGGAMLLLAFVAKIIGGMKWETMGKAAVGIVFLGGIITGLIAATRLASDKELKRIGSTLLLISISIGVLAGVATLLGMVPIGNLAKGIIAVDILGTVMARLIKATRNANSCKGNIIAMTVAIGIITASIAALSLIEPTKLIGPTIAMSSLMGIFALMIKVAGSAKSSMSSLIAVTGVVLILAGIIYLLSALPVESTVGSAIALSTLILAMSGALVLLSGIGSFTKESLGGVLALTAMVAPLAAFAYVLSAFTLGPNAIQTALILGGLATVLTALLIPLTVIGSFTLSALGGVLALTAMAAPLLAFAYVLSTASLGPNAVQNAIILGAFATALTVLLIPLTIIGVFTLAALGGVLALTAMAVPLSILVDVLAAMQNISNAGDNVALLSNFMVTLTDCLLKVSLVAPLAVIGVAAITALTGLMIAIGILAADIGMLMTFCPQLEEFLDAGVPIIEKLAYAIGSMVGNLAAGFSNTIADSLPKMGTALSDFIDEAGGFIKGIKMVDQKVIDGVTNLSLSILALTAADLISRISSADFGKQLEPFGKGIAAFGEAVSGLDGSTLSAMEKSAEVGKMLADMAKTLPNSGGLLGLLAGENDIDLFGNQLKAFGEGMVNYANAVIDLNVEAIENSVPAAESLSELASNLPNSGGLLGLLAGENDMDTFGNQLKAFGEGLVKYANTVIDLNVEAIKNSVPAAEALSDLANALPNSGGAVTAFTGDNDIESFGVQLEAFGTSMVSYCNTVSTLNTGAIDNSVKSANAISDMVKNLPEAAGIFETNHFIEFGKNLVSFGTSMAEYSSEVSVIDTSALNESTFEFQKLAKLAYDVSTINFSGASSFGDALSSLGGNAVNDFIKAFTDAYDRVSKAGSEMISKFISGVDGKKKTAHDTFTKLVKDCIVGIKFYYDDFYSTAKYLVQGFANGIDEHTYLAEARSREMAKAAADAAKKELDEHSPSKVGYKIGAFFGVAFVNAIVDYKKKAYNAGTTIADSARSGLSKAMNMTYDLINSDMDTQPVIRPVIDLDNISSGVNAMNRMFGLQPSMSVLSNVGSINHAMNQRIQNGGNGDVVSAINKLRDELSNVGGNTYNVNGITYDDGSNVSEAVSSLIRAARVERRV